MPGKNGLGESLHELYFSCFAFLDDCYLVAASSSDCQIMLDDVLAEFAKLGLQLHPDKCKWIADKHGCPFDCGYHGRSLRLGKHLVPQCDHLVVLGSVITCDSSEQMPILRRISQA